MLICFCYLNCFESPALREATWDDFFKNYSMHAAQLINFYSNIRIRAKKTTLNVREQSSKVMHYTFMANGNRKRLDIDSAQNFGLLSRVNNPENGHFIVAKGQDDHSYNTDIVINKSNNDRPYALIDTAAIPTLLYCIMNDEISSLPSNDFHIKEYKRFTNGNRQLAHLLLEKTWSSGVVQHSRIIFDCDHHWTIVEASFSSNQKLSKSDYRIEYEGIKDGFALPKRVVGRYFDEKGQLSQTYTVEVLSLTPGPVPEREFTLAAFGLSDAVFQPYVPPWYYVQLVLVIAGLLAFCLWQWRRKHLAHRSLHFQDPKG